jgi:glycosyltransferase involved in cell wall biosynthesis
MVLESELEAGGGAESQLRTLAKRLEELGHQVTVVTPMLDGSPRPTAQRWAKVAVGRLEYPRRPLIGSAVLNLKLAAFLWRNRHRYDAWHVHIGHSLGATTCLVGSFVKKPVIVKVSGWWELEKGVLALDAGVLGRAARACLRRATATQAISSRIAAELERCGFPRERIVLLPNAVDLSRFRARSLDRKPGEPFTVVFVGRLVDEKGLPTLLDAWAEAFGDKRDVRLKLVGEGPNEGALRARARALGIDGAVELTGFLDRVEEALADAHVGVLPSRIEGLSNVLLEMMACGLPTIASQVSGSEDFVVTGRNGWLFPVGDVKALAGHLRSAYALSGEQLAEMGRQARADVEAKAALDTVIGRLLSLYRGDERPVAAGTPALGRS